MRMNYDLKNIIAMDETAIWNDTISNTTVEKRGANTVSMKTTGHEKSKGAKREISRLKEQYQTNCVIATSENGWMNVDLTQKFCKEVTGTFSFGTTFSL